MECNYVTASKPNHANLKQTEEITDVTRAPILEQNFSCLHS